MQLRSHAIDLGANCQCEVCCIQIKRICPCCSSSGNFYDKNGNKQFRPFSIGDLSIELCLRHSCVHGAFRTNFKVTCSHQYQLWKHANEVGHAVQARHQRGL